MRKDSGSHPLEEWTIERREFLKAAPRANYGLPNDPEDRLREARSLYYKRVRLRQSRWQSQVRAGRGLHFREDNDILTNLEPRTGLGQEAKEELEKRPDRRRLGGSSAWPLLGADAQVREDGTDTGLAALRGHSGVGNGVRVGCALTKLPLGGDTMTGALRVGAGSEGDESSPQPDRAHASASSAKFRWRTGSFRSPSLCSADGISPDEEQESCLLFLRPGREKRGLQENPCGILRQVWRNYPRAIESSELKEGSASRGCWAT